MIRLGEEIFLSLHFTHRAEMGVDKETVENINETYIFGILRPSGSKVVLVKKIISPDPEA